MQASKHFVSYNSYILSYTSYVEMIRFGSATQCSKWHANDAFNDRRLIFVCGTCP